MERLEEYDPADFELEEREKHAHDLFEAITVLHEHGLVHGDVRKENLMYRSQEGRLVLNDLSMSMAATSSESFESDLTAARDLISTWIIPDSPYHAELERTEENGLGTSAGVREIVEKLGISVQAACLALGIPTPRPTTIGGKKTCLHAAS